MEYSPGLRGVVAGETKISTVGMEGTSLRYRGYDAIKLTETHTYEDVASLIINDDLNGADFTTFFKHYYTELDGDKMLIISSNKLNQDFTQWMLLEQLFLILENQTKNRT